ncbi:hypothetical protein [Streptomyces sp. NRRL S-448]|uniref:hypothetical protein n=1 Tax=Streptomyces sp. NRRL S-448 TaxID=1463907 RepID=UPI003562107D
MHRTTVVRFQSERYTAEQQQLLEREAAAQDEFLKADGTSTEAAAALFWAQALAGDEIPPGMSLKDFIHLRLDEIGLFPVAGEPADAANCITYAVESNIAEYGIGIGEKDAWKDALLSCASVVPVAGWLAAPLKATRWANKFGTSIGAVFESLGKLFKNNPCKVGGDSFPAGTRVLMGDGASRPIELVKVGDRVLAA